MKKYSIFIIIALTLTSCESVQQPAPIIFHHKISDKTSSTENSIETENSVAEPSTLEQPEIMHPGQQQDKNNKYIVAKSLQNSEHKIIYHEVQFGETIEDIAKKYHKNPKEIARLNNLLHPYELEEFEILKIRVKKASQNSNNQIIADSTKIEAQSGTSPQDELLNPFDKIQATNNSANFIRPVQGDIITKFNAHTPHGRNKGINIAAKAGSEILAVCDGRIIYADYDAIFGKLILMKVNNQNKIISYAHLQEITANKSELVKQGQVIGYVGSSGQVTTPQLHFGVREGKEVKNPEEFIKF